mmetsp:Transcript_41091/g.101362  ORF Transcript_41091/g.101362 Transcript_41091/m.101362 type:complete len:234 (-) Transcript_41091:181-882(-)
MADTVLAFMEQQNRPFNATNISDALGKHGIKKGLAQKYLDSLADQGKINVKEAGKQKVFFALQSTEGCLSPEEVKDAKAAIKARGDEVVRARAVNQKKQAKLGGITAQLTAKQMKVKAAALAEENEGLETKLGPLRKSKGADISAEELRKTEDNFVRMVETWASRKRKFTDLFETILESTGAAKKKMGEDIGVEWDEGTKGAAEKLAEYRKLVDDIKRKRAIEARQKKFKTNK